MDAIGIPFHFANEVFEIQAPDFLVPTMESAIISLVPKAQFGTGRLLETKFQWGGPDQSGALQVEVRLSGGEHYSLLDTEIADPSYDQADRERRLKERVRLGVQRVVEASFNLEPSPWGILTGVRPTKLVHSLLDRGFSKENVAHLLLDVYALSPAKVGLLIDVAQRQRAYFHPSVNHPIGIYLGIPFCPTRCSYCSFAAYPLGSHGHLLADFLRALHLEIKGIGSLLRELNIGVESVYLGGGTPTTVQGDDLRRLLAAIQDELFTEETVEFTVEAGRPETLSLETLAILQNASVGRISINPQTMHDSTLEIIGRKHSVEEVRTAFALAREIGIPVINMDIILGLPGEGIQEVEKTLQDIAGLGPDNLTVHSLALKRASELKKSLEQAQIAQEQGKAMADLAREFAKEIDMIPYYLYRQRHILGDLENIGYAKPGLESIYNIQMMEERQTILALGGGGITKLVAPDHTLSRLANPKCPATYSQQILLNLDHKINQLRQHLLV